MPGYLGSDAVEMLDRFLESVSEGGERDGVWGKYEHKATFGEVEA